MKTDAQPTVDLNDMIDALDTDNIFRSFVNKVTGQIVRLMDGEDFSDIEEDVEDDFIPDHYIPLPDSWDLNKYEIMEDFCHSIEDEKIQDNLYALVTKKS